MNLRAFVSCAGAFAFLAIVGCSGGPVGSGSPVGDAGTPDVQEDPCKSTAGPAATLFDATAASASLETLPGVYLFVAQASNDPKPIRIRIKDTSLIVGYENGKARLGVEVPIQLKKLGDKSWSFLVTSPAKVDAVCDFGSIAITTGTGTFALDGTGGLTASLPLTVEGDGTPPDGYAHRTRADASYQFTKIGD